MKSVGLNSVHWHVFETKITTKCWT